MAIAGRALKAANENPWYVLMTLYGEQDGQDDDKVDAPLHSRNLEAWNLWACRALTAAKRDELTAAKTVLPTQRDWNERELEITSLFESEMLRRNPTLDSIPNLPDPHLGPSLENLLFEQKFAAQGYLFPVSASFNNSKFTKFADFRDAKFIVIVEFQDAVFNNKVLFNSALFGHNTNFISTVFTAGAIFDNADFYGITCYKGQRSGEPTLFGGATSFQNAKFRNYAHFHDLVFGNAADVSFSSASFGPIAEFDGTTFGGRADFSAAQFRQEASFSSVTFCDKTKFSSATFEEKAQFRDAKFKKGVEFIDTTFSGRVSFLEVKFGQPGKQQNVSFVDCQFAKPTNFRKAIFHSNYPDFAGAVLHDKTAFTDQPGHWPKVALGDPEQAKASCAVIRHNLGRQGLPEAEHFFFRREMGFAGQIGGWWERLPYRAFGVVSDYGYSIARPVLWLVGLWLVPAFVFLQWFRTCYCVGDWQFLPQALSLSFSNIFNFFGFQRSYLGEAFIRDLGPWLHLLSAVQTIFGFVLLFFLGLGLRTRFRMR
jgi:Pentapeptide repeats (9 copies)